MTYFSTILLSFVLAFLITLALTPASIRLAPRIGAMDTPKDERRMHTRPIPRLGVGLFIGILVSLFCAILLLPGLPLLYRDGQAAKLTGVIVGGALIFLVGAVDDMRGLSARVKFFLQICCACVVCAFGVRITFFTNLLGGGQGYFDVFLSFLLTVIWIVGITNTINLIDGLDGLAAGVAAIAAISIAYTAFTSEGMFTATVAMAAVAGGALGFLPFNFHPARIFMGDSGSLFLGFMLASISIIGPVKGATVIAVIVPVLVLGVPIIDTCFAILRRLVNGRSIMEADRGHLHHRLMAAGMGQRRSVLTLYGVSGVMGVAAVLFSEARRIEAGALFVIALTFIYIFLTDATSSHVKLRGVNTAREEKKRKSGR
jgi:UDP-GlcNAc:undecaprenyl-phosphate GlcNAc-1-phosphate transferase